MLPSSKTNNTPLPEGVYTDLSSLLQLRHQIRQLPNHQRAMQQTQSGGHRSRTLNRGMEFEEVRIYQPGDDVRSIDWRVTARTQIPHTKCYREEKEKPVITLVDQRRSLFFGSSGCFKSVYACHLAGLINWSTLHRGDRAGGLVLGTENIQETRPVRSTRAISRWLQLLSSANQQLAVDRHTTEPTLLSALKQLKNTLPTGAECSVISDFYDLDTQCEQLLFQLSKHNPLTLYWVIDPMEIKLPIAGKVSLSDGINIDTLAFNQSTQKYFQQAYVEKKAFLENLANKHRFRLLLANTETPPDNLIVTNRV